MRLECAHKMLYCSQKRTPAEPKSSIVPVFNFCFIPLIYFFYPETQNLTLEQVDKLFTGDKILLHWKDSMGQRGTNVRAGHDGVLDIKEGAAIEHQEKLGSLVR